MSRAWMPLYVGDYLRDTKHLKTIEHGAYILLICHYWVHGPLENDPKTLQRITGLSPHLWRRHWPILAKFFTNFSQKFERHDAKILYQKRIDAEIEKAEIIKAKKRMAANKGAKLSRKKTNIERIVAKHMGDTSQPHIRKKEDRRERGASGSTLQEVMHRKGWIAPK